MSEAAPNKFFLTTPIYYVNARPHIGHAYTTIVADVLARRHRLLGDDTFFLTGTDEHGQKIERSAAAAGIPPQQFTDQVSATFREPWRRMGLTFDDFIRTTEPRHKQGVQKLFRAIEDAGYIYLDTYTGAYCVSDEAFVDVAPGAPCPECCNLTETLSESNFYFKLSEFQQPILDLIESNTLVIQPETLRNEVLSFVRGGLRDLSISRTGIKWGIPVPGHPDHVIYVWLDALANYMTAVGYGSDAPEDIAKFARYWPADLHLIGKEIARFHCVYWPAFLLAAKLPLPRTIAANGWLLFQDSKMSKSKGNVVRIETILDAFGTLCPPVPGGSIGLQPHEWSAEEKGASAPGSPTKQEQDLFASDILRYFLLREIPFGQDGNFSLEAMVTRYNADLANGYGNLVSRTLNMLAQSRNSIVPAPPLPLLLEGVWGGQPRGAEGEPSYSQSFGGSEHVRLIVEAFAVEQTNQKLWPTLDFNLVAGNIWYAIGITDGYLSNFTPWRLAKSTEPVDSGKLDEVLYTAAESIRIITALLYPILPYATASVWRQLGLGDIELAAKSGELKNLQWGGLQPGTKLGPLSPIFPRADKKLLEIMTQMEQDRNTPIAHANAQADAATPTATEFRETSLASAGPRTATFAQSSPGGQVAASAANTTEREGTPAHTEAASGIFAAQAAVPQTSVQIGIEDFAKIELRVAKILVAERIPKADKLLRLEVDLGYEKRQILSGIAEFYTPEELIGRRIVVITNLAPRRMRGLESHGMLLAASDGDHGKPVLATFGENEEIPLGSRLK
jgi:methionyl-tRNA synthetase